MSDEYSPSLEESSIDELIDELGRRSIGVIVVMVRESRGSNESRSEGCSTHWRGGRVTAVGLAEVGIRDIRRVLLDAERDAD